jgi:3'(2'), 5'-bisphosphate nucleotidase
VRFDREVEVAARAARAAGATIMDLYGHVEAEMKGKGDPVTEADRRSNEQIVGTLRAAFPGDGIVAEESKDVPAVRTRGGRVWFVDPLDGTKEFLAKNGEFSVMVGLAVDGVARVGAVYRPEGDVLWTATPQGAVRETAGVRTAVRVSDRSETRKSRMVSSRSHREPVLDRLRAALGITQERPSGSVGLKVGLIVDDLADLYVHPSGYARLWDTCAPEAILVAAGGRMTDCRGRPIRYDVDDVRCADGIVASNGLLHDVVVAWTASAI